MERNYLREEAFTVTFPGREVEERINEYFGGAKHSVTVNMVGRTAVVSIKYEDFRTMKRVRRDLEDMIPNLEIINIEREFTDEAYLRVVHELLDKETEIYVKEGDGTLKATNIGLLLDEELMYRDLG